MGLRRYFLSGMIISLALFSLTVCAKKENQKKSFQPHMGQWSGVDRTGTKGIFVFREDGTGSLQLDTERYDFRYVVDYSKEPVWLDLMYTREGKPFRAKTIIQFVGENQLELRTFFDEDRPTQFFDKDLKNTMILKRDPPKSRV